MRSHGKEMKEWQGNLFTTTLALKTATLLMKLTSLSDAEATGRYLSRNSIQHVFIGTQTNQLYFPSFTHGEGTDANATSARIQSGHEKNKRRETVIRNSFSQDEEKGWEDKDQDGLSRRKKSVGLFKENERGELWVPVRGRCFYFFLLACHPLWLLKDKIKSWTVHLA